DMQWCARRLQELGEEYVDVLADHRRTLREEFSRHGGVEVGTEGDAFFVAFAKESDALAAAAGAPAAARGGTAPMFSSRRHRAISPAQVACATSAYTGSRTLQRPSGSTSSTTVSS